MTIQVEFPDASRAHAEACKDPMGERHPLYHQRSVVLDLEAWGISGVTVCTQRVAEALIARLNIGQQQKSPAPAGETIHDL